MFVQRGQSCLSSGCVSVGRFGLVSAFRSRWIVTWLLSTVSASSDQSTPGSSSLPPELWYLYILYTYKHKHICTNSYNYIHIQYRHTEQDLCVEFVIVSLRFWLKCVLCLMQYERPGASPKRNSDGEFSSEPGDLAVFNKTLLTASLWTVSLYSALPSFLWH